MKKIKINHPELTDSQILKHKNFNNIANAINANPVSIFKTFKFWGFTSMSAVAVTAIIIGLTSINKKENIAEKITTEEISKSVIIPPIPEGDIPYESHSIDNSKDTTIQSENGSLIFIPANAFIDGNGIALNDDIIKIKYREFHNPYDLFVSGIPMDYDSAGQKYTFETAGMLEILAYKDGNPLYLKENKELYIDLISSSSETDFNLYLLDTNTGVWSYEGKDEIIPINNSQTEMNKLISKLQNNSSQTIPIEPIKPKILDKDKYSFEVKVNDNLRSNFVNVDKVLFEVDESKCEFDPVYYTISWENIDVNKNRDGSFNIELSRSDKSVNLVANPVYKKEDYEQAMKNYNKTIEEINRQKAEILSQRESRVSDDISDLNSDFIDGRFTPSSFRRLVIPSMGLWNCDRPMLPPGTRIMTSFINNSNEKLKSNETYVVNKDKNQIFRYLGNNPTISVETKSENIIWTITDENKLAITKKTPSNSLRYSNPYSKKTFKTTEYESLEGLKKLNSMIEGTDEIAIEKKEVTAKTYPNPTTDYVNIKLSDEHNCILQLLNENGQMIDNIKFSGSEYKWEINQHPSGNYFVVVLIPSIKYKKSFKIVKI
ncbi:MAG: T9SS type A sorting domain-containing protein [Saprospiraceae bacterium]|nr:T9SS type A sorting domain-containing protein [Saprospiraceae bacterium]